MFEGNSQHLIQNKKWRYKLSAIPADLKMTV